MASLTKSRFLFFTTSPRTPFKMVPEIKLLGEKYSGKKWELKTQKEFMRDLLKTDFFEGSGANDLGFAARDRITRAPKSLGFVDLEPKISITDAGKNLINSNIKEEVLLRQLLKFQLPSPYHTQSKNIKYKFNVKPYLEILRLVKYFGKLTFDEIMLFGLQLIDYNKFDKIVKMIEKFRKEKSVTKESYSKFKSKYLKSIINKIYKEEIKSGDTKVRESKSKDLKTFYKTKASNMRDYTDACFRYLRATGMVNISQKLYSLSIAEDKEDEIDYILENVDRKPVFIDDKNKYKEYLFDGFLPRLYTDNKNNLINKIKAYDTVLDESMLKAKDIISLKEQLFLLKEECKKQLIQDNIKQIKEYEKYDDIVNTYKEIKNRDLYDLPLMLEWNTWRAMNMLDGGVITANLKFDDNGKPMSTAQGNVADIFCDYGDFGLTVEVTMSKGARQYEMEGEPVARHLANYKKEIDRDAYCLFVAPEINEACIAHFYALHNINISYYGGTSIILPIELSVFEKMLEDSYKASYTPNPSNIKSLFEYSKSISKSVKDESEWFSKIREKAINWLD